MFVRIAMQCFFDSCSEADSFAAGTKTFGIFSSTTNEPNLSIHIHECCEIFLCISGGKSFLIDDRVYDVKDGDLFIINQFEAHKVSPAPDVSFERYIMHVHPTFLDSNSSGSVNLSDCFYRESGRNRISLTPSEAREMKELFDSLRTDYGYGDELYKKIRVLEILLMVNKLFGTHGEGIIQNTQHHRVVQLAIDYINNNYSQELTLDNIAKSSYVSVNQLCRLFSRYCGTTVAKYIISKRITEAKKLLGEGKSVTDTAFMCGFNDYANFIRVFKKTVGVPPGKYKNSV